MGRFKGDVMLSNPYICTMSFSISTVRFTANFAIFDHIAIRIHAIETVEKSYDQFDNRWRLRIRLESGKRYEFLFRDSVDNFFDRLTE